MVFRVLAFLVFLIFPACKVKNLILARLGVDISPDSSVANSLFWGANLEVQKGAKIGFFNIIWTDAAIHLHERATIGHFNFFSGTFDLVIERHASISNFCQFKNAGLRVIPSRSLLRIGPQSRVTSFHYFDLSGSIILGSSVVIGGRGSEFWTHGFLHDKEGCRYIRISDIRVDSFCYFGSRVLISPGAILGVGINVLPGSSVSGVITKHGLYGNGKLMMVLDFETTGIRGRYSVEDDYKCGNPRLFK